MRCTIYMEVFILRNRLKARKFWFLISLLSQVIRPSNSSSEVDWRVAHKSLLDKIGRQPGQNRVLVHVRRNESETEFLRLHSELNFAEVWLLEDCRREFDVNPQGSTHMPSINHKGSSANEHFPTKQQDAITYCACRAPNSFNLRLRISKAITKLLGVVASSTKYPSLRVLSSSCLVAARCRASASPRLNSSMLLFEIYTNDQKLLWTEAFMLPYPVGHQTHTEAEAAQPSNCRARY